MNLDDSKTSANWRNSRHAQRDDVAAYLTFVKSHPEIDPSLKKLTEGMVAAFRRQQEKAR